MKTILAALDLEPGSEAVLARAVQLASAHGAWLVLLHVVDSESLSDIVDGSGRSETDLQEQLRQQALTRLEESLVETGRTRRTDVRVEFGSPHEVITRVAEERSADLVVIGPLRSQGRSLSEKVLGSTADRVIRASPAPVLVVKIASVEPYRQVATAVDFSLQSAAAARVARKLVPDAGQELIHVVDFPLPFEQALLRTGTPQAEIEKYRAARVAKGRDKLYAFARDVVGGDQATRFLEGEAGPALIRLSQGRGIDLLVLGPHGRGVVLQALLGSVAQRVLREAVCDVLIVGTRQ
jgi:nucleotide-binding universal stress UspA family protein